MGVGYSIYTKLALYGSNNECAKTDTVSLPVSEVCDGTVSLDCCRKNEAVHVDKFSQSYYLLMAHMHGLGSFGNKEG